MGINKIENDSVFKVKFDATPAQSQRVFKHYIKKLNAQKANLTEAQKALLEREETKKLLETADQPDTDEAKATCIIELLGVKSAVQDGQEESKDDEQNDEAYSACCVDFSYREKGGKKLDVERQYVAHFKAWKALLNPWVNMSSSEI